MEMKDLLAQLSSPADWGVTMLGYAAGFAADAVAFPGALPSATVGAVAAVGAFGAKKTAESLLHVWKQRETNQRTIATPLIAERAPTGPSATEMLERKAQALAKVLEQAQLTEQGEVLAQELQLWRLGLAGDREFSDTIARLLQDYRMRSRKTAIPLAKASP